MDTRTIAVRINKQIPQHINGYNKCVNTETSDMNDATDKQVLQ